MDIPFGSKTHRFVAAGRQIEVAIKATTAAVVSRLLVDGAEVARDETPAGGAEATRNHHLASQIDGRPISVEAGYIGWWKLGARATLDGDVVYDSDPGKTIAYPKSLAKFTDQADFDPKRQKAGFVPIAVDIAMGIVFFLVARYAGLTTAAVVGAILGIALLIVQRFVKTDLTGGLAIFGVVMLAISAAFALVLDSGLAVQLRSVIVGLLSAGFFLFDGFRGGPWLGKGLARYMPYANIDQAKLAKGMGFLGLAMAAVNLAFIWLASEDVWLFFTSFLDIPLVMIGFWFVMQRARQPREAT